MKVQVLDKLDDGSDFIIFEYEMDINCNHNSKFHCEHMQHMEISQNTIDCLSVAHNKALQNSYRQISERVHAFGTACDVDLNNLNEEKSVHKIYTEK